MLKDKASHRRWQRTEQWMKQQALVQHCQLQKGPRKRPESEKDRNIMAKALEITGAILNCDKDY